MKNRVRTPGDGLLRPMKRGQFRPAERNAYVSEMAKRYHTSVPREKKLRDLEHLVDPMGVVAGSFFLVSMLVVAIVAIVVSVNAGTQKTVRE